MTARWAGALLLCVACGDAPLGESAAPQALTVLAASSLTDAFTELEQGFEAAYPDVAVTVSFAGSQALATQVRHGIQADVFASANEPHIAALADEGLVEPPRAFARNSLALAVADTWPHPVTLETLPSVGSLVVGGDDVPVGRYTDALFDAAQARYGDDWRRAVEARVVSREPNVRLVVTKVGMQEADAAVVYATDLVVARGVHGVPLPEGLGPQPAYFHATLTSTAEPDLARAWVTYMASAEGQQTLAAWGFAAP